MGEREQRWLAGARRMAFDQYRMLGKYVWITACGPSMRPLLGPGISVLVECGAAVGGPGDIVLFAQGDLLIAHRVVAWRQVQNTTWLVVKGDSEPYADPLLPAVDVLGVVRAFRTGSDGVVVTAGCVGNTARASAHVSRWLGRGATLARRATHRLPKATHPIAEQVISLATRFAAAVLLTPIRWTAPQYTLQLNTWEGGDS